MQISTILDWYTSCWTTSLSKDGRFHDLIFAFAWNSKWGYCFLCVAHISPLNVKGYANYHLTVALIAIVMHFGKQLSYLSKHMITFNFIVTQMFKWYLCALKVHGVSHSMVSDTSCMRFLGSPHTWAELRSNSKMALESCFCCSYADLPLI